MHVVRHQLQGCSSMSISLLAACRCVYGSRSLLGCRKNVRYPRASLGMNFEVNLQHIREVIEPVNEQVVPVTVNLGDNGPRACAAGSPVSEGGPPRRAEENQAVGNYTKQSEPGF
ncbi:hypothetical protein BKA70DRAFT_1240028 [Coprinopsis sp. MPI-PUGE-AT-0042]|nr:hypothetical protein BKA70DRAFT_1240028 [Coprinopsis sp. MPI-PUGE-AT-0042]